MNITLLLSSVFLLLGSSILLVYVLKSKSKQQLVKHLQQTKEKNSQNTKEKEMFNAIIPSTLVLSDKDIEEKLFSAGYYSFKYAHLYMPLKYLLLIIGCLLIGGLYYDSSSNLTLIALLAIWVVAVLILPDAILTSRVNAYRLHINRQLPYMIDLLAVCVQTGMTIESSLVYLAREINEFNPKFGILLRRLNDRAQVVSIEQALDELYEHIPTSEMRSFVMTLKQSLQYGSSIYDNLTQLSADIRQVTMLTIEEKIGKLAAKMSVPLILFIMFPIVILITAPGIMRMIGVG